MLVGKKQVQDATCVSEAVRREERRTDRVVSGALVSARGTTPSTAGESTYKVYLITDTVQNVTVKMDDFFAMHAR